MSNFTGFYKKKLLKQIQIFLRICPFSNLLKKKNFLSISVLLSKYSLFLLKREVFSEFPQKCFKTTEKHSLAVYVLFWGEIQFLFIFVQFYCFEQKRLFTTNPNFPLDCSFSNLLRKTNFLSFSLLLSEIGTFLTKKRSLQ